jgi:Zn-dependent protease with chaperone function
MRPNRSLNVAAIVTSALLLASHSSAQTWLAVAERLRGQELTLRPTAEGRQKVYLPTTPGSEEAFAFFRKSRLFPLRAAERVRVTKADPRDDRIEIELTSSRLGRGRIDLYGPAPTPETLERWLDEIFELRTPESEFARYIGNRETRVLHLRAANHLPPDDARESHRSSREAAAKGYRLCGVCFMPAPDVADYWTEQALALMSLQQVRSSYHPYANSEAQERIARIGNGVLERWPVPLKGYRYRFQVVDSDDINAFAVPTGYIFVTRGLMEALERDDEVAAVLAHEIAHVESRHTYRIWRNAQKAAVLIGILGALSGATNTSADDIITRMSNFAANLFLSGFGRDREREADLFASLFLQTSGKADASLHQVLQKLKFARDVIDPLGNAGAGLFATHPDIEERLSRARRTSTRSFPAEATFHGLNRAGDLVAVLRLDAQRLHGRDFEVVATLSTTAELGDRDSVNSLTLLLAKERVQLRETTAESILPLRRSERGF